MWQVRFYCRTGLNYNGKVHKPGDEWVPAGLLNDEKIMYGLQVTPKYSKIVGRKSANAKERGDGSGG